MKKFFGSILQNAIQNNIDSERAFLSGVEHCPPLPPGVLEYAKELARTRCAANEKLAYVLGCAITKLKPATLAEVNSIFLQHEASLVGRYPVGSSGWSPVDVCKFLEALSVDVKPAHENEEYLYVATHEEGEWHFLSYYPYLFEINGKKRNDYFLGWIDFNGLRVTANGNQSSIKEIVLFAQKEITQKNWVEVLIGRGLYCVCETLLHMTSLPLEILSAMQESKQCTVNSDGVEISHKNFSGYYRPADMDLTMTTITLRKDS